MLGKQLRSKPRPYVSNPHVANIDNLTRALADLVERHQRARKLNRLVAKLAGRGKQA